jgi:hypothetical protein
MLPALSTDEQRKQCTSPTHYGGECATGSGRLNLDGYPCLGKSRAGESSLGLPAASATKGPDRTTGNAGAPPASGQVAVTPVSAVWSHCGLPQAGALALAEGSLTGCTGNAPTAGIGPRGQQVIFGVMSLEPPTGISSGFQVELEPTATGILPVPVHASAGENLRHGTSPRATVQLELEQVHRHTGTYGAQTGEHHALPSNDSKLSSLCSLRPLRVFEWPCLGRCAAPRWHPAYYSMARAACQPVGTP